MAVGREAKCEKDTPDKGYSHGTGGQGQMDHVNISLGPLSVTAMVPKWDRPDGL